jgi:hypothetical protein
MEDRRMVSLNPQDELFLKSLGQRWEVIRDGSIWVLVHDYALPEGYVQKTVILAVRIEAGYPAAPLDMMYVYPAVSRLDGKAIRQTEVLQPIDQKQFQRWSRHRTPDNPWLSNQDSLETHMYFIEEAFRAEFTKQP